MTNGAVAPETGTVTVVVSRRVNPGRLPDYYRWIRRMVAAATQAPGNMGATVLIPEGGKTGLHHLVLRFDNQASVDSWENSPIRQKLTREADAFSPKTRQAATGLETWFALPEHPEIAPPPPWKMFLITSLAVYIASTVIILMQNQIIAWPLPLGNILTSVLVVAVLTWGIMPFFSRYIFQKWLYPGK
jgi:antibiotic biosynthesis monooxygenase (ABM) superfamily enzyme